MKKIIILMIIAMFAVSIVVMGIGCKEEAAPAAEEAEETVEEEAPAVEEAKEEEEVEEASDGPLTIGLSMPLVGMNPYTSFWADYFEKTAAEMGYETVITDAEADAAKQANQIDTLMEQDVDALVVWCLDVNAIIPSLKAAKEAGFIVVASNTIPAAGGLKYIDAYTGPDDIKQGGIVGTQAAADLEERGLSADGEIVQIIGIPGYSAFINRQVGFEAKLFELAPDATIIGTQPSMASKEKALTIMENFITTFGDRIDGVYCHDDFIAEGALQAIEASGYAPNEDIMIWGLGGSMLGLGYVKDGKFTSTTSQQPSVDADKSLKITDMLLKGMEVELINNIETPIVTAANVAEFLPGEW